MQKKLRRGTVLGILMSTMLMGGTDVYAQDAESTVPGKETVKTTYVTQDIDVEGKMKDPFGNVMTEQSYYRTGGDVNVIDRDMILSRTVDKFLTRERTFKWLRQWSHRTVAASPSEEAHRLLNKFGGCSNSS